MTQAPLIPGKLPPALLSRLLKDYTHRGPRLVVPAAVGEDAAVIEMADRYLVVKTDPVTFAADAIGYYAVHVNANDIAAMGATPQFFLASVLLPAGQSTAADAEAIFRSVREAADSLGVLVCGGHTEVTSAVQRPVVVGQMLGEVAPRGLVRSSGLRPGEALILTKGLAIEATAIIAREKRTELLQRGVPQAMVDRAARFLREPGISVVRDAKAAAGTGCVHAMHDPTEGGVATGLLELARASGVGLRIQAESLPIAPESERLCAVFELDPLGIVSSGALLVGCAAADAPAVLRALQQAGVPGALIGSACRLNEGLTLWWGKDSMPLPEFAADEITRLESA
jgi:hydrogenase expression/formation protein HypE